MAQGPEFKDFLPGMEFFQTLLKGAGVPSQFAGWAVPTLDVQEIEQRITDLKAVLGWLQTHAQMTQSMIQALEVQRMTLQALRSMNVDLQAFAQGMVAEPPTQTQASPQPERGAADAAAALFDPVQWWNTMTQQFTELASKAMHDAGAKPSASETAAQPAPPAQPKSSKSKPKSAVRDPASGAQTPATVKRGRRSAA
jgi:hypothetical protein